MGIADLVDGMAVEGISGNNCPAVASWLAAIGSADSGCIAVGCVQYIAVEGSVCTACLAVADEGTLCLAIAAEGTSCLAVAADGTSCLVAAAEGTACLAVAG